MKRSKTTVIWKFMGQVTERLIKKDKLWVIIKNLYELKSNRNIEAIRIGIIRNDLTACLKNEKHHSLFVKKNFQKSLQRK